MEKGAKAGVIALVETSEGDNSTSHARHGWSRQLLSWPVRFVALASIWGLSFLFIKVSVEVLAPLQVAFARAACGAAVLLMVLPLRKVRLPRGRKVWTHMAVAALLMNAGPFALFSYGEQHVSSALAGIWNATAPLVALPVALILIPQEKATRQRLVGLGVGFAGVLVVLGVWTGLGAQGLEGNLLCMGAAICYGVGFPYARRYLGDRPEGPLALTTGQLLCATVELGAVTPFFGSAPSSMPWKVVGSILAIGILGTGLAYILNYSIIQDVGAVTASTVTYLIPIFSTLAGVLILGEDLSWNEPVGALIIILGAALTQRKFTRKQ
ncbi:DMT family transporter [Streptomyces sp. HC307]|uniref:DMT family transporter n=1 Tax=Streptomyces flavusporus TaxID=3385496 RepID=UPI00391764A8